MRSPSASNFYRAQGLVETRSAALYANLSRQFGARWELDAGIRQTWERKSATAYNANYTDDRFTTVAAELADFTDRTRYSALTPRLALSWHASDGLMLYAQASRGFKGGSYNVRANAVFRNDYRNIQLSVLTDDPRFPAGFPDFRNAGSGTSQGAELEWRARLGPHLDWTGNVGYLDARYDHYIENGVDVAHSRNFPNAPRLTSGTSLIADVPLRSSGWLRARIDGRYQSETWPTTDTNPLLRQPGYALWNASLTWISPRQRWELTLRGENLGDRAYRTSGFAYPFGIVTGYYGPPRTYALTLAYSF